MANLTQQGQQFAQKATSSLDPRAILQALIQASGVGGSMAGVAGGVSPVMQLPEAMLKGANKALSKMGEQYAMEAASSPDGLQNITQIMGQQQALMKPPQMSTPENESMAPREGAMQAGQPGQPSMNDAFLKGAPQPGMQQQMPQQPAQSPLTGILSMLFNPSSVDQSGAYQPASLLGGLMRTSGQDALASQQAINLQPNRQIEMKQREANEVPLGLAKRQEIGLETEKAILTEAMKMDKEGRLKPSDLLGKFEEASNKKWIPIRDAYNQMQSGYDAALKGDLGAQISQVYQFMKIQSPESTVMQGEFATAENAPGVPNAILKAYNGILKGRRLSPQLVKSYYGQATRNFKAAESQQKSTVKGFSELGKKNGLDPSIFMRDTGMSQDKGETSNFQGGQKVGKYTIVSVT